MRKTRRKADAAEFFKVYRENEALMNEVLKPLLDIVYMYKASDSYNCIPVMYDAAAAAGASAVNAAYGRDTAGDADAADYGAAGNADEDYDEIWEYFGAKFYGIYAALNKSLYLRQ